MYLMEVLPTPLGGMFACVSVEYRKEPLAAHARKVDNEAARWSIPLLIATPRRSAPVGVFHGPAHALVIRHADLVAARLRRQLQYTTASARSPLRLHEINTHLVQLAIRIKTLGRGHSFTTRIRTIAEEMGLVGVRASVNCKDQEQVSHNE